ncbi:hypothetical protein M4S82_16045 [Planococcus sp. MERTA32b]|nr:hypothetical protein [Planococcus sp. MER TA 32b]
MMKNLYVANESGQMEMDFETLRSLTSEMFVESVHKDLARDDDQIEIVKASYQESGTGVSVIMYSKLFNSFHVYEYRSYEPNPYSWIQLHSSQFRDMLKVFQG